MSSQSLCGSCSMTFSLFKRKNRCIICRLQYCTSCFRKGHSLPHRNVKHCLKCHALSSEPFIPSELMLLSVKELKGFLQQNNVSSTGCKEKRDLVDVIVNFQRAEQPASYDSYSHDSTSSQSHHTTSSDSHDESSNMHSPLSDSTSSRVDAVLNGLTDFFGLMQNENGEPHSVQTNSQTNTNFSHNVFVVGGDQVRTQTPVHVTPSNQVNAAMNIDHATLPNQVHSEPTTVWSMQDKNPLPPVSLESFKDSDDIKKLTVKELKVLLDANFVDYKGCCEKDELVQRALMLWQSKKFNENVCAESNEVTMGDSDLCKVCMDCAVDCVLLECGHLVTCVDCGKKLRECPMCRQNITRIVRVFKS